MPHVNCLPPRRHQTRELSSNIPSKLSRCDLPLRRCVPSSSSQCLGSSRLRSRLGYRSLYSTSNVVQKSGPNKLTYPKTTNDNWGNKAVHTVAAWATGSTAMNITHVSRTDGASHLQVNYPANHPQLKYLQALGLQEGQCTKDRNKDCKAVRQYSRRRNRAPVESRASKMAAVTPFYGVTEYKLSVRSSMPTVQQHLSLVWITLVAQAGVPKLEAKAHSRTLISRRCTCWGMITEN